MSEPERVLITGGAGFIGRRSAELLAERGFAVTILDSRIAARESLLEGLRPEVHRIEGDIKDAQLVLDSMTHQDAVVHLAAGSSFLMYEERPVLETVNVFHGFLNVLEAVRRCNVSKLVYASTSAVYEGNPLPYHEDMALVPPDHKALAKKAIEEFAQLYAQRYGTQAVALRPFSVYGPDELDKGGYANVISLFAWAMLAGCPPVMWGDGTQTRDFIFVDDLAEIICGCLVQDFDDHVVNAGTGVETSFNEVVALINGHLETPLQPAYVPVPIPVYARRLWADTARQRTLGLEAQTDVETGVARVVEYIRSLPASTRARLARAQWEYTPVPGI